MVSMTEKQKLIYNHFLEVSKKINNKPVKYRKNFDNFPDENYLIKQFQIGYEIEPRWCLFTIF